MGDPQRQAKTVANSDQKVSIIERIRAQAAGPSPSTVLAEGKPALAEGKPKVVRPLPLKPQRPRKPGPTEGESRRTFLSWVVVGWTAFTAACTAAFLAAVRFMYPNVLNEPPSTFKVGPPDKFEEGHVYTEWKNEYAVWIVRNRGQLYALRAVCTHLGCTPNWLEGEEKFKCPCHGSGFRKTGVNFEGPAPRPLERYTISIADDGQVQIDKSSMWHYELGQWTVENGALIKLA